MFFLKKLLQMAEQKGFRAGTGGADKHSATVFAVPAAKAAGRVVRRENGGRGFADNCRCKAAAEAVRAAGRDRRAEAERFAWYFAVRDFFARSAQGKSSKIREGAQSLSMRKAPAPREIFAREASAPQNIPVHKISFGGETAPASRSVYGRGESRILPRAYADFSEGEMDTLIFDPEFFADLASLRGLNVEERRRGGF